jgi:hypothetical protein
MIRKYDQPAELSAFQAISEAQKIAFSAVGFQAIVCLLRLGILKSVSDAGKDGASSSDLAEALGISEYGIKVLLDMGLTMSLVWMNEDRYVLDKVGYFLLEDEMSQVNVNFAQDVCYEAMNHLMASIKNNRPEGLKVFGNWPTIYPGLSLLPTAAKESWFAFDHFYSGTAFPAALPFVFDHRPSHILDIGGNTGVWAAQCVDYDADVRVTIVDLPEQTVLAQDNVRRNSAQTRIDTYDMDVLDARQSLPSGADTIWMSQFIACFSEAQIHEILRKAVEVMDEEASLFILEAFWDRQQHDAAAYSVNATSLYFTCIANGSSRMYHSKDVIDIAQKSGLSVDAQHDGLGIGHTLLHCRKAPAA